MSDEEVVENLANKGHSYQEISEALNQADIKSGIAKLPDSYSEFGEMQESALSKSGFPQTENIPAPSPSEPAPPLRPVARTEIIPPPVTPQFIPQTQAPSFSSGDIQELIESVIEDRWQQVVASVGDISLWKSRVDDDLSSIKQEVLRIEDRMAKLQSALIGRVDEYSKSISKVGSEVAALEKVFEKIMSPLTFNIKELERITQELKKK